MIKGRCLCAGVKYEYKRPLQEVVICHCDQCKRAQGTPFASNAPIDAADFEIIEGQALLAEYFSSESKKRVFCSRCGSPLYSQRTDLPSVLRLRLGSVIEGDIPAPKYEIYGDNAANWFCEDAERPRYAQNVPTAP